ncbi:hypothetical protein RFI_05068 [Reticulomyxa filosa]|uniref:Uncharacterized protein n=1 Tax=Reticulomyxa filosa TaxID=46433 RepID=X6P0G4_RETFI|nr:hypothetical protein RFI_05068 [Reticulomyxa filosa]|eukprot:ETO32050.1 hypothetical protein RFI_05068 [Reticulomyxa filosa]
MTISPKLQFWCYKDAIENLYVSTVGQPSLVLTPLQAWEQSNPLYFQMCLLIWTNVWTFTRGKLYDWSAVDRLWSISPILYGICYVLHDLYHSGNKLTCPRNAVIALLVTLWGLRLTWNFAIKGGYNNKESEDYRWEIVRNWFKSIRIPFVGRICQELFYLLFVNFYQNTLIWSFVGIPMYLTYEISKITSSWNTMDYSLVFAWSVFFWIESIADYQMFQFQTQKKKFLRNELKVNDAQKKIYERGFFTGGLYSLSRHPNYFAEQCMWWVISLWPMFLQKSVNWSGVPAFLLTLLFQGSTTLAEQISSQKYPDYKIYQQRVSRLIPWFARPMN